MTIPWFQNIRFFSIIYILLLCFFLPTPTFSAEPERVDLETQIMDQIDVGAGYAGFVEKKDPRTVIVQFIEILLAFVGTVFLVLILIAGYWLFTARGQEEKVENAKKTIRFAVIGLIIVLSSYSFTLLIGNFIQKGARGEIPAAEGLRSRGSLNPLQWR